MPCDSDIRVDQFTTSWKIGYPFGAACESDSKVAVDGHHDLFSVQDVFNVEGIR